jgi:hypothetical protein
LSLNDETRSLDLVRGEDVDGKEVSETMVSSGQMVEDRVVDGPEVASE